MPKGKGYSKDKVHSNTKPGQSTKKDPVKKMDKQDKKAGSDCKK